MFGFLKKTGEKAEVAIEETKEKVGKLADSADKFISDGNNQMKTITIAVLAISATAIISNIVSIGVSIHKAKNYKTPQVNVNIYVDKVNRK